MSTRASTHVQKPLGKFELPPAPVEVTFEIDANSILKVSELDKTTGKSNRMSITNIITRVAYPVTVLARLD